MLSWWLSLGAAVLAVGEPTRRRGLRVLLAGDAIADWHPLSVALEQRGHASWTARNTHQVLGAFREIPIDIVIMDLEAWGLEVFHTTRAIRKLPDHRKAQSLLLAMGTGSWVSGADRCLAASVDWCCPSPVAPVNLVAVAEHLAAEYLPGSDTPHSDSAGLFIATSASVASNSGNVPEPCGPGVLDRAFPVFDQQQALRHCFGSERILQQMAAYLLDHADRLLEEINVAVQIGSPSALRSTAHWQLKGTVLHLALRSATRVEDLNNCPGRTKWPTPRRLWKKPPGQVQRLKTAVIPLATSAS